MNIAQNIGARAVEFIPAPIRISVRETYHGIDIYVKGIYLGDPEKRAKVGTEFLRGRVCFSHQNPFVLSRSILFFGIIAAVGLLIAKAFSPFLGAGVIIAAAFFVKHTVSEHREGSHLKKAIAHILGADTFETISPNKWQAGQSTYDSAAQVVTFTVDGKTHKFYVGQGINPSDASMYMEAAQVTSIWNVTQNLRTS